MERIRNFIRNMKLRNKLLISYLMACLIPLMLTTSVIYGFSVKNLEEEAMELAHLYSSQIVTNIDRFTEEYDRITKLIVVDNEILSEINKKQDATISEQADMQLQVRRLLMRIAILRPNVDNIMLRTVSGDFYQYSPSGFSVNQEQLEQEIWMNKLLIGKQVLTITGTHRKSYYYTNEDGIVVTIGRRLYDTAGRESGILMIDMSPFELVEMNDVFKVTRNNYHIQIRVSTEDEILYDSDVIDGGATWEQVLANSDLSAELQDDDIIISDTAFHETLRVTAIIPRNQLMQKASNITLISFIVIFISIILIIGLSFMLSKAITYPITQLQHKLTKVGEGQYDKLDIKESSDELGILIHNYNRMIEKIKSLIKDVYLEQIKQRDAKLMALRTQINPHMLYNTLESIRMKALMKDDFEVAGMISILAKMFRVSLGKEDGVHTIRAELEYVQNYIKLQNIRFRGQFDLKYDVEENLLDSSIIPLVFQPIVENCIEHGNRGNYEKMHIQLTCMRDGEHSISIRFQDDGRGMEPEKMYWLNRRFTFEKDELNEKDILEAENLDGSIGLYNIAQRIQLRYGFEYYVRIADSGDWGTIVEMKIPLQEIPKEKFTEVERL